jgi:succinate dehydrogenase flavoprotein subunit
VFLDISWIKSRVPNGEEHIKRKLPGMYHQFKELAGVDITKETMEVGPTCHYIMGGIRVDAESQMSTVAGLFAAGECAAGLHGANRLGGNSLSDLLVFGKRAGEFAALYAKANDSKPVPAGQVEDAAKAALAPFGNPAGSDNAFMVQRDLQQMMQGHVGIVRTESEMAAALPLLDALSARAEKTVVDGNRDYNPGWHTSLDLGNLITISRAVTQSALLRKESRGGHFRDDFPGKDPEQAKVNTVVRKATDGTMSVSTTPVVPLSDDQKALIEELG